MRNKIQFVLIAAHDVHHAIGRDNTIPWTLPEDMRHFRDTTSGGVVMMGRRTWQSLGRPLPNRTNVVISTSKLTDIPDGVIVGTSIDDAIEKLAAIKPDVDKVYIIGGQFLYQLTLQMADELIITEIKTNVPHADTFFPPYNDLVTGAGWSSRVGTWEFSKTGLEYRISTYSKVR